MNIYVKVPFGFVPIHTWIILCFLALVWCCVSIFSRVTPVLPSPFLPAGTYNGLRLFAWPFLPLAMQPRWLCCRSEASPQSLLLHRKSNSGRWVSKIQQIILMFQQRFITVNINSEHMSRCNPRDLWLCLSSSNKYWAVRLNKKSIHTGWLVIFVPHVSPSCIHILSHI